MLKQLLKIFTLVVGVFPMSVPVVQASGTLIIHGNEDQSHKLEAIRRISFKDGSFHLKTSESEMELSLSSIKRISFGNDDPNGILLPGAADTEFVAYVNSGGEVIVKTTLEVLSLTVYDLSGRPLLRAAETNINAGILPQGIYLLQIGTAEGNVTKKIIKN